MPWISASYLAAALVSISRLVWTKSGWDTFWRVGCIFGAGVCMLTVAFTMVAPDDVMRQTGFAKNICDFPIQSTER